MRDSLKPTIIDPAISSGFKTLHRITLNSHKGNFIVVTEKPSIDNNTLILSIIHYLGVIKKIPLLFFSLKMTKEELTQRMLSSASQVDLHKVKTGILNSTDWPRLTSTAGMLSETQMFIDDTLKLSIDELSEKIDKFKREHKIRVIIIDSLKLNPGLKRRQPTGTEIIEIYHSLKKLAKDLKVSIVVISKPLEKGAGKHKRF